eukprot:NODE_97_length_21155_cov_0.234850.p1 type:complete len:688 gc:universal NODE_97_length_21155_cov_0.234850:6365-4302(-)
MDNLTLFLQYNFVGPYQQDNQPDLREDELFLDINNESFFDNLHRCDLLVVATNELKTNSMERLLCLFILQQCLSEPSYNLYAEIVSCYDECIEDPHLTNNDLIEFNIIRFYIELFHSKSLKITRKETADYLNNAVTLSDLNIELTGAPGKRTKFQKDSKMQLVLKLSRSNELRVVNDVHHTDPENIMLNHDVLLNNLTLDDDSIQDLKLTPLEQCVLLAKVVYSYEMHAKEDLVNEQILPYINYVLKDPQNWSITSYALLLRSRLEMSRVKTMERALLQYEQLGAQMFNKTGDAPIAERLQYFPCLGISHYPTFQLEIADHYLRFGALKSALEIFKSFNSYEKAALCLKAMGLDSEAESYIVNALKKTDSNKMLYSKLLCYLGDCRQDHTLYVEAWEHSEHKLSLAQFRLAHFYYTNDKFELSLDCYQEGLQINPMKPRELYIAGCCALRLERYEESASYFRRTTNLDDNPEAWNNLATALLQINKDSEAQYALLQAIKESSSWKVWMNYMYVCVICNDLQDAIRAGLQVFTLTTPKWQEPTEEPDFNIYNQLILKTIDELKRTDNEFLENRIFELLHVIISKAPCWKVWTIASKLYIATKDYKKAFLMIECAFRDMKDDQSMYYNENKFNLFCEVGVELIRIADLSKDENLRNRGYQIGELIIENSKLITSDLEHLKEVTRTQIEE